MLDPAASASACLHWMCAEFSSPVQSTTHTTIGLPAPSSTYPIASSGSSTSSAGLIQPPHNECPIGGVTSNRNVPTCRFPDPSAAGTNPGAGADAKVVPAADVRNPRRETAGERSCGVVIREALWCGSVHRGGGIGGTQLNRSRPNTRATHCRRLEAADSTGRGLGSGACRHTAGEPACTFRLLEFRLQPTPAA